MLLLAPVLILWIQISQMNGQQIKHFPEFLLLQEGENFTTYCNSSSFLSSSQWYKQRSGSSPVLLMILAKGGEVKTEQRLTGQLGETKQHSSLHLTAAQLSDAGTYFCTGHSALEAPAVCPQTSLWA
uniref:Ig-like domain-containing protein n=1 Tax=Bos indicus x Bos taurus TaxID=30522 RepID=A0A4W2GJR4_BOBOX